METRKVSFMLLLLCAMSLIIPGQVAAQVVTEMPQLIKPSFMTLQGDRLYVVEESTQIHIFQQKEGRYSYQKTFGKHGEGPGEFGGYIHRIQGEAVSDALKERCLKPDREDPDIKPYLAEYLKRIVFPDQTPGFDYFELIDLGFAVRSNRFTGDRVDFVFFDQMGKEIKRKALVHTGSVANGRLFAFHKGTYLTLRENIDQEVWELVSEAVF